MFLEQTRVLVCFENPVLSCLSLWFAALMPDSRMDSLLILNNFMLQRFYIGIIVTMNYLVLSLLQIPMDNKRILAVHEAGHILLAHLFPRFDWHAFSHLLPGGSVSYFSFIAHCLVSEMVILHISV